MKPKRSKRCQWINHNPIAQCKEGATHNVFTMDGTPVGWVCRRHLAGMRELGCKTKKIGTAA